MTKLVYVIEAMIVLRNQFKKLCNKEYSLMLQG